MRPFGPSASRTLANDCGHRFTRTGASIRGSQKTDSYLGRDLYIPLPTNCKAKGRSCRLGQSAWVSRQEPQIPRTWPPTPALCLAQGRKGCAAQGYSRFAYAQAGRKDKHRRGMARDSLPGRGHRLHPDPVLHFPFVESSYHYISHRTC